MLRMPRLACALIAMTLTPPALSAASAKDLKVVASFSIIADFAKNVGGERIALTTLVGPMGDAHVYEPKPADAAAVAKADLVLVNGLGFEGFLERLVEASGTSAPFVELSKGGELLNGGAGGHDHAGEAEAFGHGAVDPHAWQSIPNAKIYVKNIADAFCAADAAGCDAYRTNAAAYLGRLDALDAEIRTAVASIPANRRVIITSHDAFFYFGREYGLTFLAPEGVTTEQEASAADVAALIDQVRHDKAAAIFVENITNRRLVEQIASETGITVGGTLYSDALSDENGPAATYIDMMRHNALTIKGAAGGN